MWSSSKKFDLSRARTRETAGRRIARVKPESKSRTAKKEAAAAKKSKNSERRAGEQEEKH
jgi:hypothetical protein